MLSLEFTTIFTVFISTTQSVPYFINEAKEQNLINNRKNYRVCGYTTCKEFGHLKNIIQVAYDNGFKEMAKLIVDFDLVDPILDEKYITLFAASDHSFQELQGLFQSLHYEDVRAILKRHIIPDLVKVENLSDGQSLLSLNEDYLMVRKDSSITEFNLFLQTHTSNIAEVEVPFWWDIDVPYAKLHMVDKVLL